ncbi:MAG TPA: hypothetical protein VKA46_31635, partial [Gemmataceae bacterium]|nr:hypothetical protein [Gemmataceae bacterium]
QVAVSERVEEEKQAFILGVPQPAVTVVALTLLAVQAREDPHGTVARQAAGGRRRSSGTAPGRRW